MYLIINTRPNTTYAIRNYARRILNPSTKHFKALD